MPIESIGYSLVGKIWHGSADLLFSTALTADSENEVRRGPPIEVLDSGDVRRFSAE